MKHRQFFRSFGTRAAAMAGVWWLAASPLAGHCAFTAGNLAVFSADSAATNNTTFTILELSPSTAGQSSPVNSIAISGTGPNALRTSGSATSTGYLADSNDGSLLAFNAVNSAATTGNVNAIGTRGVGTLDNSGAFALQTTYSASISGGTQARGATSINDSLWYIADQDGIYTNSSTRLNAASPRGIKSFGGMVYVLRQSTTAAVVSTVSPGGQTVTGLNGLGVDNAAQDFYLISSTTNGATYDVLYVLTTSGIKKYSLVSGTWTANSSYATVTGFGLCVAKSGNGAVLYVTTGSGATSGNSLVKVTDAASYNANISVTTGNNVTLYTAPAGTTMKGVAFAPVVAVPSLAIDNTGTPAAANIIIGTSDVPVFGFRLSPGSIAVDFTGLKLTTAGTAASSDLSNFRVVYDADDSGTYNSGDTLVSGSGVSLANPINFTIAGQTALAAPRRYLVIADVAGGAGMGHTFTGSIAAAGDVISSGTTSGSAAGNQQTIASAPNDLTMSGGGETPAISSLTNDAAITTASQGVRAWQVTFSNPAGNEGAAIISALTFTQGANNQAANWQNTILAAELFDGSTALAAGAVSPTNIVFSSLSVGVSDGGSKTLTLRISLKSTVGALTDNTVIQFALASGDVVVSGNGVTTATISSDPGSDLISVVATKLVFTTGPARVITNVPFAATVQAQDANGNRDVDDTTMVTISLASGTGALTGGDPRSLSSGTNKWATLAYDTLGAFAIQAAGGSLTAATSNIIATPPPSLNEVLLPQYIQGIASGSSNSRRLPFTCLATISNLTANATYRYFNQCVVSTDSATMDGAGNCIIASSSGSFVRTTSPTLSSAGNYGTFTTDTNGDYTGWFITEPTGNSRFGTTGNQVFMRIMLNNGAEGTTIALRLTTANYASVLPFNTTGTGGTGIRGNSSATNKNFVVLYDNVAGTGRPLAATFLESDGLTENTGLSYVQFYSDSVDGTNGAWGTIIPNTNPNGVRRIEQRALADGSLVGVSTDSDGVWPSGADTVSPLGSDATPIVIASTDATLNALALTVPAITGIHVSGGSVLIDFTGGAADATTDFNVLSATSLSTPLVPISATITTSGPGVFRATVSVGVPAAFYRIKR